VISAVGSSGTVDRYEVKFRVPRGMEKGTATVQVSAAWIEGMPAMITVH